jgi:hypothetical protein
MKKSLFILFLTFILAMSAYSQDKPKIFSGSFKTGYYSSRTIIFLGQAMLDQGILPSYDLNAFYGKLQFNINYKGFNFYTSNRTFFNKDKELNYANPYFNPLQTEFVTGLKYSYKIVSINYEHLCSHSIEAKNFAWTYDDIGIEVKF